MKMLVTGGAGFIGSNLVDQLIVESNEVHVSLIILVLVKQKIVTIKLFITN